MSATRLCDAISLIDDDSSKAHLIVQGKPVLGIGDALGTAARNRAVKRGLIMIPSATGPQMVSILKSALDAEVE